MSLVQWRLRMECKQEAAEMAANPQKLAALVNALIESTQQGRIEWESIDPTQSPEEGTFSVSMTHGTVMIWSRDRDGVPPFVLQIIGDRGQVVEEILSHREVMPRGLTEQISQLYSLACGSTIASDRVIDSLLNDLGNPF
ncbi:MULTISPECIES: hypothetical protein [unclassified Streptomyces]|uniref:hypothetical protein n=1 Tax=unclassified Streptomyces TaxID=2593676 RepID=UPI0033276D3D